MSNYSQRTLTGGGKATDKKCSLDLQSTVLSGKVFLNASSYIYIDNYGIPNNINLNSGNSYWSESYNMVESKYVQLHGKTDGDFTISELGIRISDDPAVSGSIGVNEMPREFSIDLYYLFSGRPFRLFPCDASELVPRILFFSEKDDGDEPKMCSEDIFDRYYDWKLQ